MNNIPVILVRAAIVLTTIGMAGDAVSGSRLYDLNLLLDQPHPFVAVPPPTALTGPLEPAGRVIEHAPVSASPEPITRSPAPVPAFPTPVTNPSPWREVHDYTFSIRLGSWLTQLTGEISRDRSDGTSTGVDLDDDLGLSDFEVNFAGTANLRLRRHDIWVDALRINSSGSEVVERTFTFGSVTVNASRLAGSEIDLALYDVRYGYSFFDLATDGFRLGPTLGVAYFNIEATVTDEASGKNVSIDETFPLPRIGLHGEMPWRDFLLEATLSGLYIEYNDLKGYAVEGDFSITWRPLRFVGGVAGYRVIAVDADNGKDNYDVTFRGPYLGLELRY